jgi:Zinc finger C-x8-C-x5-C-x3-H type (and similar)
VLKQHGPEGLERECKLVSSTLQERAEANTSRLCFHLAKGLCDRGAQCRFSHDLAAYAASRPSDLPGQCPYTSLTVCPFGILCRWASKHADPDPLTKQWLLEHKSTQEAEDSGELSLSFVPN